MQEHSQLYGVMGEFETAHQLLHAAEQVRDAGYTDMDAYAPYPVEGLSEALGLRRPRRRPRRIWLRILGERDQLSHECRRPAAE